MDNLSMNPEQIQAMIAMLQTMLDSQTNKDTIKNNESSPTKNSKKPRVGKSTFKKNQKKERPNKFLSMPEINMHKEDIAIDKKLRVQPPVPRARPFTMIKAVCRICGKRDEINPALLSEGPDRYKCNKCSTSAG
jgi:hypothetical protein